MAEVGSLWAFAYGYRFSDEAVRAGVGVGDAVPPMEALVPGPTNEALARLAAGLAVGHAGVLGFADHAVRCVMTARAA